MSKREPFLKTGITLANLNDSGTSPVEMEQLKTFISGKETCCLASLRMEIGILKSPDALEILS